MKTVKKHKAAIISILIFVIVAAVSVVLVSLYVFDKKKTAVEKAGYITAAQVSELERALSSYIQVTDTLRILLVDSNGKINDFDRVAQELYNNDDAFRSIQLAPEGNVQYVYPLEGNEDAFGDLFGDPARKTEAEYARDTGNITLAGPFELYQSGLGIVIRQPVYLEENGRKDFWGFAIVVLNVPEIFHSVNLDSLESLGYSYQLWRMHPDTKKKQVILESKDAKLSQPVEKSFFVPGSEWHLSVSLKDGWLNYKEMMPLIIVVVCITILLPVLSYAVLKINEQKARMAEISTRDYLTSLYNGRKMSDVMHSMIAREKPFLLVYIDVDKFKEVNDTYGHTAGDILLKTIADRIQNVMKKEDYAFRIGGDEFIMIVQNRSASSIAAELEETVTKEVLLENIPYYPRISIGYAAYPKDAADFEEIIKTADEKMYAMKRQR